MRDNPELRSIPELVTDSLWCHEQESALGSVYLICHYDFDYTHYGLVQVWDSFGDTPEWRYSLWYWGDGELAEHLCDFPDHKWGNAPYVASALHVESCVARAREGSNESE